MDVPIFWLGLLFSMMCLALLASDASDSAHGDEAERQRTLQIELYREKVVQCLLEGEYTKAGPYVLETMTNYLYIEFVKRPDAYENAWFILGLVVSMALRMGYHRDPRHFPGMSPLRGEVRRWMWSTALLGDMLISSQMGMPCMIDRAGPPTTRPSRAT